MKARTLSFLALAGVIGAAVAVLPALATTASTATLQVNQNCVENNWPCWTAEASAAKPKPATTVTIAGGGEVAFSDHAATAAAVNWTGGPATPMCTGVPVTASTGWEGSCRFEQPGSYEFESSTMFVGDGLNYTKYKVVVEPSSTGTTGTTTTTATTPATTTTSTAITTPSSTTVEAGPGAGSPLAGSTTAAVKLAAVQHGRSVHGSVQISRYGVGGRLEVSLLAAGAVLARADSSAEVPVGHVVRSSLYAGSASFAVPLNRKGQSALHRRKRLALTVRIVVRPLHGTAVSLTRRVVLHG